MAPRFLPLLFLVLVLLGLVWTSQAGETIEGLLSAGDDQTKPYVIKFTLKNNSPNPITIFKWGTPFEEDVTTQMFDILDQAGKKAEYQGFDVERDPEEATDQDYLTIAAGRDASAKVDLLNSYELFSGRNRIKIGFDVEVVHRANGKTTTRNYIHLNGEFTIDVPETNLLAQREAKRQRVALLEEQFERAKNLQTRFRERVKATTYLDCGADLAAVQTAVAKAKTMLADSETYINRDCAWDERTQKFFGKDSATARTKVKTMLANIKTKIDNVEVNCCLTNASATVNCNSCVTKNWVAFANRVKHPSKIFLCTSKWLNKPLVHSNRGSRATTIIHEISHLFGTRDHGYREENIYPMAYGDQDNALNNADTYALFHSYQDAFPGACNNNAGGVSACGGGTTAYLSGPIDECDQLYKSTYDASPVATDSANVTMTANVKAHTTGPGLSWGNAGPQVVVKGAIEPVGRKCCILACKPAVGASTFQVFARAAGKTTCAATPDG